MVSSNTRRNKVAVDIHTFGLAPKTRAVLVVSEENSANEKILPIRMGLTLAEGEITYRLNTLGYGI